VSKSPTNPIIIQKPFHSNIHTRYSTYICRILSESLTRRVILDFIALITEATYTYYVIPCHVIYRIIRKVTPLIPVIFLGTVFSSLTIINYVLIIRGTECVYEES
jgi:hypothetical protein